MSVGIVEFNEIGHASFGTLFRAAAAPIDAFGRELGLPLGKLLTAADIQTDVLQSRLWSRIGRDAMGILIRPQVGNLPSGDWLAVNPSRSRAKFSNLSRSGTPTPTCMIS